MESVQNMYHFNKHLDHKLLDFSWQVCWLYYPESKGGRSLNLIDQSKNAWWFICTFSWNGFMLREQLTSGYLQI
jgi:hypothetical protein